MAQLSKWAIFLRAFLVVFLSGAGSHSATADQSEREAWDEARRLCSADGFFTYLSRYPAGAYVEEALTALSELGALQVAEGEDFSNFCLNPVRELPVVPQPAQAPVVPRPSGGDNDPY